jgi:TPR repeat protein
MSDWRAFWVDEQQRSSSGSVEQLTGSLYCLGRLRLTRHLPSPDPSLCQPPINPFTQLAMDGDQEAMVRVGHMLLSGYGIKQDKAEAAKWLRHAW